MDERALRTALLVRALETTDRDGALVPPADRAQATRETLRERPELRERIGRPDPAPGFAAFLASRAERVLARLSPRHPALAVLAGPGGTAAQAGRALPVVAFGLGLALSALDRNRLVNVLAFPLAGLLLWNLAVYVAIVVGALRRRPRVPAFATMLRRGSERRLARWLRRSEDFDASLARALQSFVADWHAVARPWLNAHAARLFHLGAAAVAAGLVAGMYWRGLTLEYRAGWESTFLGAEQVRALLAIVYGPASALTGIPLPSTPAEVEALHWRGGAGGGVLAAPWIHLVAVTAVLWIVVPRLLLVIAATVRARIAMRTALLPPALLDYARELLAGEGVAIGGRPVDVVPYAYEPPADADAALARALQATFGTSVRAVRRPVVAYGSEDAFLAVLESAPPSSLHAAVLVNLASTPEAENHGALIAGVRDAVRRRARDARTVVVADSGPYARRMGDGAHAMRVEERAAAWREFVRGYGLETVVVDLGAR